MREGEIREVMNLCKCPVTTDDRCQKHFDKNKMYYRIGKQPHTHGTHTHTKKACAVILKLLCACKSSSMSYWCSVSTLTWPQLNLTHIQMRSEEGHSHTHTAYCTSQCGSGNNLTLFLWQPMGWKEHEIVYEKREMEKDRNIVFVFFSLPRSSIW